MAKLYYEIAEVDTKTGEEWTIWEGFDYDEALKAKENAISDFEHYHTAREKEHRIIECRAWELDCESEEEIDLTDILSYCSGYDDF